MRLTDVAIREAFRTHHEVYATSRGWAIPDHIECWARAWRAFEQGSAADFEWLYNELKRRWQVFRGPGAQSWSAEKAFEHISALDSRYRRLHLSALADVDLAGCWDLLEGMSGIKSTKSPSVVAISKFLHFWSPRLFVIVDDGVMWQRVLSRSWLQTAVNQERRRLQELLPHAQCIKPEFSCDLMSYLAVLSWSSRVIRLNPGITPAFTEYVQASAATSLTFPIESYDAAAMEWLLLGLAEMPPPGVDLNGS